MVFIFSFNYGLKVFLPIELEVMTLCIVTMRIFLLDESQHHQLLQFNELDELQMTTH